MKWVNNDRMLILDQPSFHQVVVCLPVFMSVRSSHHVAELLTAGTLAQASRPEAQFLHQHQRLLTKVVFPVPRHPPIRIAHPPHTQPIAPQLSPPAPTGRAPERRGCVCPLSDDSNNTRSRFGLWRTRFWQGAETVSLWPLIESFNGWKKEKQERGKKY